MDETGEQDPFVTLSVLPHDGRNRPAHDKTSVAFNQGCNPVWNSPVYEFTTQDANVDMLSVEVYDSGEDDGVSDQLIGDASIPVDMLLRSVDAEHLTSLRWIEDWYPIFHPSNAQRKACGEVRIEYRFVTEEVMLRIASESLEVR